MPRLWIFGPSLTLPWELSDSAQGWPTLVAKELGISEVKNFGTTSVDNFFIYQFFLQHLDQIRSDDILIIGWSHPNRKMFVLDRDNPIHLEVLPHSLYYPQKQHEFIRSRNPVTDNLTKWRTMRPKDSGTKFYDNWFKNYYSEYEQRTNFQAYYDSINHRAPCTCLSIFFSRESVEGIKINPTLFYLDFVLEHQVNINENDFHLNEMGHRLFSKEILTFLA